MAAEELRGRVHHDVGTPAQRLTEVGRGDRGVDDERDAGVVGDRGEALEVGDGARRIGDHLGVDRPGRRAQRGGVGRGVARGDEGRLDAEASERHFEQCASAAVEMCGRHDVIAAAAECGHRDELGRLAAGGRDRADAAFQARDALLEGGHGRVRDPAVDRPELLEREQIGGVSRVLEDEAGGLVDRHGPGTAVRVGPTAACSARVRNPQARSGDGIRRPIVGTPRASARPDDRRAWLPRHQGDCGRHDHDDRSRIGVMGKCE